MSKVFLMLTQGLCVLGGRPQRQSPIFITSNQEYILREHDLSVDKDLDHQLSVWQVFVTVKWPPSLPSWLYCTLCNKVTLCSLNLKSRELHSTRDSIYKNWRSFQISFRFFQSFILAWTHGSVLIKNRIGYNSIMFYTAALTFLHHCGNYDCLQSYAVRYSRFILYIHFQNQPCLQGAPVLFTGGDTRSQGVGSQVYRY